MVRTLYTIAARARRSLLTVAVLACVLAPRAAGRPLLGGSARAPVHTADPILDRAERVALRVLARDTYAGRHLAAPSYDSAWIRDSFAWGMIPWNDPSDRALAAYSTSELQYWFARPDANGAWITNVWSGWYDETPILIGALADSYRITGDAAMLRADLPRAERAWAWLARTQTRPSAGSAFLIYAAVGPHIAADWADQVARSGYATGIEAEWYRATCAMATMEAALGRAHLAEQYRAFAAGIKRDINRLLWRTGAPHARNAPAVGPIGHYTGWLGARDYFELDSNYLCILYGIASPAQAAAINGFITAHGAYLLGLGTAAGMPARTLYGDYEPDDYAAIHYNLRDGTYQNAYWPSVGALVAIGAARSGDRQLAAQVLHRLATLFVADNGVSEWYTRDGKASGAAAYQWPARMFLIALYDAYLGLGEAWQKATAGGRSPSPVPCLGAGAADIMLDGRAVRATITPARHADMLCAVSLAPIPARTGA